MSVLRVLFVLRLVPSPLVVTTVRSPALTLNSSVMVLRSALEDVWEEVLVTTESAHAEAVSRVLIVLLDHLSKR